MAQNYKTLRALFHASESDAACVYQERFHSKEAHHFDFEVSEHPAFFLMDSAIYELIVRSLELDRDIRNLAAQIPNSALQQYMDSCLIDEVLLTNKIEGVSSTRKEISTILEHLNSPGKAGRLYGLTRKYRALSQEKRPPLNSPADIRALYDELVLPEVREENPANVPDGKLFRKGSVSVISAVQKEVHRGAQTEEEITQLLKQALRLLTSEELHPLPRTALFHFMFGYIHPFYDGNGRVNRFISSSALASYYHPVVSFKLSLKIHEKLSAYYKAFTTCEHLLNKGDLTPFVIAFAQIFVSAQEEALAQLEEKSGNYRVAQSKLRSSLPAAQLEELDDFSCALAQASIFAENGITTNELCDACSITAPTAVKRRKKLKDAGLLASKKQGHYTYYSLDLDALFA
ncbi:MAG: Fic family protein [Coriobacteriia bacterium]|nr:Fic family protein [Coriobacteriia bacterium]